jgi:hypothetical protein
MDIRSFEHKPPSDAHVSLNVAQEWANIHSIEVVCAAAIDLGNGITCAS